MSITRQLGYKPLNMVEIGARDKEGAPLCILLYPLNFNAELKGRYMSKMLPFPTIYWIASTSLHKRISELEDKGWISKLQSRLDDDEDAQMHMVKAHDQCATERLSMLSQEDTEAMKNPNCAWQNCLTKVGIAGMKDFKKVKCLHCHLAHYLCRPEHNNIIGKWVHLALYL
jgi:hypothetical protein